MFSRHRQAVGSCGVKMGTFIPTAMAAMGKKYDRCVHIMLTSNKLNYSGEGTHPAKIK